MSEQTKLIAFYLPQYHPFPENDAWWGKGFTEWTNVTKAKPNFSGHEQPHLPTDLGFYDLRLREARAAQAELAKAYGIHGFCYYYYWFGGKRLLQRPLEAMLADGEPDIPFCLCWANENWTRRWDGAEHQVLMAQQHSPEDDIAFIHSLFPYFRDSRYIRVDGRPLLLVYRISLFPTPAETVARWRDEARRHGFGELHIAVVQSFNIQSPLEYGCDSAVEFPPHGMRWTPAHDQVQVTNPQFQGRITDYLDMVRGALDKPPVDYRRFRGVMPGFDNTPRRQNASDVFINNSPQAYETWLERVIGNEQHQAAAGESPLVFINAWNEWGEGNHLEPDRLFGHAYLEATRNALKNGSSGIALPALEPILQRLAKDAASERQAIAVAMVDHGAAAAELEAVLASTSWRMTAPLRAIKRALLIPGRAWRVLKELRRRHGGWAAVVRKIGAVIRDQRLYSPKLLLGKLRSADSHYANQALADNPDRYAQWSQAQDQWRTERCRTESQRLLADPAAPTISLVMPVYNPSPAWLAEALDSVLAQRYGKWELCIADDASTDPEVARLLKRYSEADRRIRVVFRPANGHIAAASQSALDLATGEFVAFLDHDDLLAPDALFWMARAVLEKPAAGLIYSDEDRLLDGDRRANPYFKPDWNPELLRAQNYLCHLTMVRTSLAREAGGFRLGFEGAQDYDLFLRVSERLGAEQIAHVPLVLYHWREHAGSTSTGGAAKPYALDAGKRAVQEHLQRLGIAATVEAAPEAACWNRVRYAVPARRPRLSLVIPTRNQLPLLRQCLESVAKSSYPDYEIVVINNGSDDPQTLAYLDTLRGRANHKVIDDAGPFNYARLNNDAVRQTSGEILVFLNNDIEAIGTDWLDELVSHAVQPDIGPVGARLWFPNETLQHGGVVLGIFNIASHAHYGLGRGDPGYFGRAVLAQNMQAVTGACLAIRRRLFDDLGGFDERLEVSLNDVDLCLRAGKMGFRTVWTPYAELYHHESATRGRDNTAAKREKTEREFAYFRNRWGNLLWADPDYNINLTLDRCDFSLAEEPRYESWFEPLAK